MVSEATIRALVTPAPQTYARGVLAGVAFALIGAAAVGWMFRFAGWNLYDTFIVMNGVGATCLMVYMVQEWRARLSTRKKEAI